MMKVGFEIKLGPMDPRSAQAIFSLLRGKLIVVRAQKADQLVPPPRALAGGVDAPS
jgi:hypothetical protein